jgi:integrator complex subunit 9
MTVAGGGNAIITCRSTGFVFDIIDVLWSHINNTVGDHIAFYFVSPVAKQSLLYSNILSEW